MKSPRTTARPILTSLAAAAALLLIPAVASAEVVREQGSPSADPTGRLFISPGRIEEDVEPGVRTTLQITLTNDSEEPYDVSLRPTDIGATADPRNVASQIEDGEFGAGDWLVPEVSALRLEPFETVTFDLVVDTPVNAPIGTNMAGLIVDSTVAEGPVGTDDSDSIFRIEGLIQIFLTVPGPVEYDLRIVDVDVRDKAIIGGQRFAVWDVTFQNNGTVNEHVTGNVAITSLFGNTAHRVDINELLVLRGAKRTTRVVWRDLPWIGAFTPEVRVRGDNAEKQTATGERVIIFPWWLPVVFAMSVLLPVIWLWWRRRREWRYYLDEEGHDDESGEDGTPTW